MGLEQRLARTLAAGTDTDDVSGTDHTKCVEPMKFSGTIALFASHKYEAAEESRRYTDGQ